MKVSLLLLISSVLAGYAPYNVSCPSGNLVRDANGLSAEESSWVTQRNAVTNQNLEIFLKNAGLKDFNAASFLANTKNGDSITIGIAFSGGGYRAMLSGAGQLAALDNRMLGANQKGLGGLLQASTYLVGLSGGSWLVGSVTANNFSSIQDIVDRKLDVWDLEHSIVNIGGWNLVKTYKYYRGIYQDVKSKKDAGFETTLTDVWGRALSNQFFPAGTNYGDSILWSLIQKTELFAKYKMPFPIVVTNGREPGTQIISGNSTVFEFNPFEMGSWDPSLHAFVQTQYLGTKLDNGVPIGSCVSGYDNAGFVMGTSSSLFNQFVLQIDTTSMWKIVKEVVKWILNEVSEDENDIAVYSPNPFYNFQKAGIQSIVQDNELYLVDGGEDLQNIPLHPLLQPSRGVDVIFAYDNSADTNASWPNGASMVASYERQFLKQGNGVIFPHVPDTNSFINLGLTAKPTFFGCNAKNLTSLLPKGAPQSDVYKSPLIIYTANRPFSFNSNMSTFKLSYTQKEKLTMIQNGFEIASRLNSTLDTEWKTCVACAVIRREQERQDIEQSEQCKKCFKEYCWDGSTNTAKPPVTFKDKRSEDGSELHTKRSSGSSVSRSTGVRNDIVKTLVYGFLIVFVSNFSGA